MQSEASGFGEVTPDELRRLVRDRPEILEDRAEAIAKAFTVMDLEQSIAQLLSFREAERWLRSVATGGDERVVFWLEV